MKLKSLLALSSIAIAPSLQGAIVITPTGVTSTSDVGDSRVIENVINGSGLTDVSDPTSVLDDSHAYNAAWYWLSASTAVANKGTANDEVITIDLGAAYDIDKFYYWTYERDGDRNIRTFDIAFSTDGGTTFSTPVAASTLGMADWVQGGSARDPSFARTATFDAQTDVTDVQLSNITNWGDTQYYALYELRLGAVPEPSSAALLGSLGVLMLLRRRR
ncbi:discoidin domain-containing protein [Haloferula sp. A504]|uniref:discoidin domain-containing protein n=1 Tax=Haloferula sp. A504 TaxID=3373601 RepID=UPI0031C6C9E1|nr:discoidin domain-containing protein [Verrucomicrobiaceae bacterium E54]